MHPVADLRFPRRGDANPKRGRHQPDIWQNLCRKMHEIKSNWTVRIARVCSDSPTPRLRRWRRLYAKSILGVYRLYALAKFRNFYFGSRNQVGLFVCLFEAGKQKYKYLTCDYVTYKHDEQFTSVK